MKTNLELESYEQKLGKTGRPYWSFKTNQGVMNTFDKVLSDKLIENVGKFVDVDVLEKNGFKNIVIFYGQTGKAPEEHVHNEPVRPSHDEARKSKDVSMMTSYAKDIFCAMWTIMDHNEKTPEAGLVMESAVNLVKNARKAFEEVEE